MKHRRITVSLLLVLTMLVSIMSVAAYAAYANSTANSNTSFSDMPDNWSTTALKIAVANGLLNGTNSKIMPDKNLTRAQMATVVVRVFGGKVKGDLTAFSDVKSSDWFSDYMAIAFQMGVIKGSGGKNESKRLNHTSGSICHTGKGFEAAVRGNCQNFIFRCK